jgi:hypothetical protein
LRYLRGTAPFFHDGRDQRLDDLLAAKDSRMWHTEGLGPPDCAALEPFLETL